MIHILALAMGFLFLAGCLSGAGQFGSLGSEPAIINVDDFAADPGAYSGVIAISGVVSYVESGNAVFGIIDAREYELCGVVTCAANQIPISVPLSRYSGELPDIEDEVMVYGEVVNSADGYGLDVLQVRRGNKVILKLEGS
jgi:hypothetical protein